MSLSSIFNFWRSEKASGGGLLSAPMRRRLALDYGVSDAKAASLSMVTDEGNYASRRVTFLRVFDATVVKAAGIDLHKFSDLTDHPELQLYHGNIESDGEVVLNHPDLHPSGSVR